MKDDLILKNENAVALRKKFTLKKRSSISDYKIDYDSELNCAQLEAVKTHNGPILVVAGAGTGKTKTLTYRCARLIEDGINPENILLLTFTKKAYIIYAYYFAHFSVMRENRDWKARKGLKFQPFSHYDSIYGYIQFGGYRGKVYHRTERSAPRRSGN